MSKKIRLGKEFGKRSRFDGDAVRGHIDEVVRSAVEETCESRDLKG